MYSARFPQELTSQAHAHHFVIIDPNNLRDIGPVRQSITRLDMTKVPDTVRVPDLKKCERTRHFGGF